MALPKFALMQNAGRVRRLIANGKPVFLKITSTISDAPKLSREVMDAINLESNEPWTVVVDTVLANVLISNYHGDSYVGRCFRILKFKPRSGKNYAEFAVTEVKITGHSAESQSTSISQEELLAERATQGESPTAFRQTILKNNPLALSYDNYRQTPLWRKIRRRVLQRDGKLCRRCGGAATMVHHRSYADEVMLGNDDRQLASICEGCHNIIHFDESGQARSAEETDRLLLEKEESTAFPPPKVDMRRTKHIVLPAEWSRMTSVQRSAWHNEYERLKIIRWGQSGKDPKVIRMILRNHGMSESEIDAAISSTTRRHSKSR